MLILGVDSATPVATVALASTEEILAEMFFNTNKTHSQRLMPMINNMLNEVNIKITDVDGFAVAIGPGSFTGLRIGVATVKGFAHVLKKPVVGVPTLDALAYNVKGNEGIICPVLNARKNEVYTALYDGRSMELISDYMALSPDKLVSVLNKKEKPITMVGDGIGEYKDFFLTRLKERISFAPPTNMLNRAAQVAYLGSLRLKEGKKDSLFDLQPLYIRKSEAEVRLEKKKAQGER